MWVDINAHVEPISSSVEVVLSEAQEALVRFIATGTDPLQWKWLNGRVPYVAFGLHPHKASQDSTWLCELERLLIENPLSPVGEIELDYRSNMPAFKMQIVLLGSVVPCSRTESARHHSCCRISR